MAGGTNFYSWAARAVRENISVRQTLRDLRSAGFGITDATFYRLVSSVRAEYADRPMVAAQPLDRRPHADQIKALDTDTPGHYIQHIDIWVYNKNLGIVYPRAYDIATDTLLTHGDAIETGLDVFRDHAQDYDEQILGAGYRGTHFTVPKGTL